MPNYDAPAQLLQTGMSIIQPGQPIAARAVVYKGSMAECVRRVMAEAEAARSLYAMTIDVQNSYGITDRRFQDVAELDYKEIRALYDRTDFPKQ